MTDPTQHSVPVSPRCQAEPAPLQCGTSRSTQPAIALPVVEGIILPVVPLRRDPIIPVLQVQLRLSFQYPHHPRSAYGLDQVSAPSTMAQVDKVVVQMPAEQMTGMDLR